MAEKQKPQIPLNKDPNAVSKLFDKNATEAAGHEGSSLPFSGGVQSAESGGARRTDQDPIKDSI